MFTFCKKIFRFTCLRYIHGSKYFNPLKYFYMWLATILFQGNRLTLCKWLLTNTFSPYIVGSSFSAVPLLVPQNQSKQVKRTKNSLNYWHVNSKLKKHGNILVVEVHRSWQNSSTSWCFSIMPMRFTTMPQLKKKKVFSSLQIM